MREDSYKKVSKLPISSKISYPFRNTHLPWSVSVTLPSRRRMEEFGVDRQGLTVSMKRTYSAQEHAQCSTALYSAAWWIKIVCTGNLFFSIKSISIQHVGCILEFSTEQSSTNCTRSAVIRVNDGHESLPIPAGLKNEEWKVVRGLNCSLIIITQHI